MFVKYSKSIARCAIIASCTLGGGGGLTLLSASAADAPTWIGLDTSIRDGQTWVSPGETFVPGSIDTRVSDFWMSLGKSIRGNFARFFLFFR